MGNGLHCPSCGCDTHIDSMLCDDNKEEIEWYFWCDMCNAQGVIILEKNNASLV